VAVTIKRYDLVGDGGQYDLELDPVDDGGYVLWVDHVEALRQAEAWFRDGIPISAWDEMSYEQGQRDALAAIKGGTDD